MYWCRTELNREGDEMNSLIAIQEKLIATLSKMYRRNKAKGKFNVAHGCGVAARVAENKCWAEIEALGFTSSQAYVMVQDARDVAKLNVECE